MTFTWVVSNLLLLKCRYMCLHIKDPGLSYIIILGTYHTLSGVDMSVLSSLLPVDSSNMYIVETACYCNNNEVLLCKKVCHGSEMYNNDVESATLHAGSWSTLYNCTLYTCYIRFMDSVCTLVFFINYYWQSIFCSTQVTFIIRVTFCILLITT